MAKGPQSTSPSSVMVRAASCQGRSAESAVASGVRRIEALTGHHARKHANETMALARSAAAELRTTLEDMPVRIASLMEERKKLERDPRRPVLVASPNNPTGEAIAPDVGCAARFPVKVEGGRILLQVSAVAAVSDYSTGTLA